MTITTKYNIGDLVTWKITGRTMIITSMNIYENNCIFYKCAHADLDGNPVSSDFAECELEAGRQEKGIGFQ